MDGEGISGEGMRGECTDVGKYAVEINWPRSRTMPMAESQSGTLVTSLGKLFCMP